MTGSELIMRVLLEQGVDTVFGYPGGTILNVYDALYKYSDKIKHILTSHEQGAAHAADGYARSTGKVGVCMATSGPGATNLVTGIATAYMDSVPMVAITCNVFSSLLGRDTFQEVDIAGITMPITKHNMIVKDVNELADSIREAFYIAKEGRPGPVLIDIPKDLTAAEVDYVPKKPKEYVASAIPSQGDLKEAAKLINNAKRPFIISGGGVISSKASDALLSFARKLRCPVSTTLMGIGSFPVSADCYTGMVGMHGTKASNMGVTNCDLLIAIGMRFSDRVTSSVKEFAKGVKIIHIDLDPAEINKNVVVTKELVGDARLTLEALFSLVEKREKGEWFEQISGWKKEFPYQDDDKNPTLNPQFVLEDIYHKTNGEAIVTTEVGQHQMWTAQFYKFDLPRRFVTSGGLGTMGFGTGASIGAQVGNPDKRVIAVAGDGSFRMNCNELSTVRYYNLPIIYVIMNNRTLGMVRQWQTLFYGGRYSQTTLDRGPDFVKLAEAYDIKGYRATNKKEFSKMFDEALLSNQPAVIDVMIDTDEFVLPMVAPGKPIHNIVTKVD